MDTFFLIYEGVNVEQIGIFAQKCTRELTGNNDTLFTYDSETTLYSSAALRIIHRNFLVESAL